MAKVVTHLEAIEHTSRLLTGEMRKSINYGIFKVINIESRIYQNGGISLKLSLEEDRYLKMHASEN